MSTRGITEMMKDEAEGENRLRAANGRLLAEIEQLDHECSASMKEIATLRAENERLRGLLTMAEGCASLSGIGVDAHAAVVAVSKETMAKLVAAEAENERLRAVLKRIATDDGINGYSANPELWPSTVAANALAYEQPSGETEGR